MNILGVSPFPPQKNGGATSVYEFFMRLSSQGYNIKIISYLTSLQLSPNLESIGLNLGTRMSFTRGIKFILKAVRTGIKLNKKNNFDFIYGKNITSPSFAAYILSLFLRKPLIVHTSGGDIQEMDPDYKGHKFSKGFLSFLTKLFRKLVLARAIVIIANCKIDYQVLNKIGYEKKTVLIRNGVDTERFSPVDKKKDGELFSLIFVGRAEKEKNPDHIIEIANKVKNPLIMIGGTKEEFQKFGNLSPNVEVVGITDRIEEYYRRADIFIQTSKSEGLSNALLEAMASKNVPITYPSGDAIFLIKDDYNGYLCNSAREVIERINFLNSNQDKLVQIGENAYKTIHEQFDWSKSVKKMNEVFMNIKIKK